MSDPATAAGASPELCRLIYKSDTSWDALTNESLQLLATKSAENNQRDSICGLLVLSGENFLQVLEGPSSAVNALYRKIIADKRHSDVRLLSFEHIGAGQFREWSMHVVDLYDLPMHHRELLTAKYPERDGCIEIPDEPVAALSLLLDAKAICASETDRA